MRFGEDIYALAVAMLHKKNAKHLKYFDQEHEAKAQEQKLSKRGTRYEKYDDEFE
jgi:hypothetical protein